MLLQAGICRFLLIVLVLAIAVPSGPAPAAARSKSTAAHSKAKKVRKAKAAGAKAAQVKAEPVNPAQTVDRIVANLRPSLAESVALPPRHPARPVAVLVTPGKSPVKPEAAAAATEDVDGRKAAAVEAGAVAAVEQATADAKSACDKLLAGLAIDFHYVAPIRAGACGTPQPIEVVSLGNKPKVLLDPPAVMNCPMAAALAKWLQQDLQPLALREFGTAIVGLQNGTSYACRNRNGDASGKLSEHAFANALDIPAFLLADGQRAVVAGQWGPVSRDLAAATAKIDEPAAQKAGSVPVPSRKSAALHVVRLDKLAEDADHIAVEPAPPIVIKPDGKKKRRRPQAEARADWPAPKTKEARFLQAAHDAACKIFGTVLGPEANNAHRDHLHVDLAFRRHSAFCE